LTCTAGFIAAHTGRSHRAECISRKKTGGNVRWGLRRCHPSDGSMSLGWNVGTKKNSKGYKESWIGYKLHLDVADGQIPISCILTSASLHDSQAAIPLALTRRPASYKSL
jgi:hypothetical protein